MDSARATHGEPEATPFRRLLSSVGWDRFFTQYWGKAPVHLGSCAPVLRHLPGWDDFPSVVAGTLDPHGWLQSPHAVEAHYVDRQGRPRRFAIPQGNCAAAFSAGLSLCFSPLDRYHPALSRIVDDCRDSLQPSSIVEAMAYLTPKSSGSVMHFDFEHVFVLQVAGEKHWRVSRSPGIYMAPLNVAVDMIGTPAEHWLRELGLEVNVPGADEYYDIILREGDALYVPPGYWHEVRTRDKPSLHYSMVQFTVSCTSLLQSSVRHLVLRHPMWRDELRIGTGGVASTAFLQQRLQELRDLVSRLTPEALLNWHQTLNELDVELQLAKS
jgi:ribosomal protein L16 Arg81 hydroxylase